MLESSHVTSAFGAGITKSGLYVQSSFRTVQGYWSVSNGPFGAFGSGCSFSEQHSPSGIFRAAANHGIRGFRTIPRAFSDPKAGLHRVCTEAGLSGATPEPGLLGSGPRELPQWPSKAGLFGHAAKHWAGQCGLALRAKPSGFAGNIGGNVQGLGLAST